MYCVKCGVELADSERKCPLCKTPVYYPEERIEELSFPKYEKTREKALTPRGLYFILTFSFAIAAFISLLCNLRVNGELSWSLYVIGALMVSYVIIVLPRWFRRPSPAVFAPCSFLAIALYLGAINHALHGDWFLTFALPITVMLGVIVISFCVLYYYVHRGYLYIWGGELIALGVCMPVVEHLIHINFPGVGHDDLIWSYYPMIGLALVGLMLIIVAIVKPFRESLRRIFLL